jgi:N-acyl-D-aspartate/D-glutamate deacylase
MVRWLGLLFGVLACSVTAEPRSPNPAVAPQYELVLRGGRVMDPETGLDAVRDVGISTGVIASISASPLSGTRVLDVRGLVVAPGFIDLHVHGQDPEIYALRAADGVTTALELEIGTADVDAFYGAREGKTLINYGASVGHVPVRMAVMGDAPSFLPTADARAATTVASAEQLEAVRQGLRRGLAAGALAVGMGIMYTPAATADEVRAVFAEAAPAHAPVVVHMRFNGAREPDSSTHALEEVLGAAKATGAALHVAHLHSTSLIATQHNLELIEQAHAHGLDVTTECYPYTAGMTDIASGVFNDGWQAQLGIDYDDLLWAATGERLDRESFERYRKTGGMVAVFSIPEPAIEAALRDPLVLVASDSIMKQGKGHPRSAGTSGRLLGHYVREAKLLSLMEALRKLTLLPARRLERRAELFKRKGRVQVGADADLTVFDESTIVDRSTWAEPTLPTNGIAYVLVAGTTVVDHGALQPSLTPGRGLRAPAK